MSAISENLKRVQERIARAAERSGRSADEITLVAVSKTQPVAAIEEAVCAGVRVLGENRIQEAEAKVGAVNGPAAWHLVGHLQRNKVKSALRMFELIHSVDSLRLAQEIGKRAVRDGQVARVLVQVNTSGAESQFRGCAGARAGSGGKDFGGGGRGCGGGDDNRGISARSGGGATLFCAAARTAGSDRGGRACGGFDGASVDGDDERFRGGH